MAGDVTIDVEYSSINFKDGLALTGASGVVRADRLIPGVDIVGTVASSVDARWRTGDRVIVTGQGVGEEHHGGLAERARVNGDWLIALPDGLSPRHAAAIGTAGLTAMLAVLAIERHGGPEGDVLVTGATGGVGSIAIALLTASGRSVAASTGHPEEHGYLRALGAADIIDRAELSRASRPLESQRWAAAIDVVGSLTLATVLAQTKCGGIVASCGLAQGSDLPATVMPFILRGVTLAGIDSVRAPDNLRRQAWARLATDLDRDLLDAATTTVGLADAVDVARRIRAGAVRGRTVVDVRR